MSDLIRHWVAEKRARHSPTVSQSSSSVRRRALRSSAFSSATTVSIGFRSGPYRAMPRIRATNGCASSLRGSKFLNDGVPSDSATPSVSQRLASAAAEPMRVAFANAAATSARVTNDASSLRYRPLESLAEPLAHLSREVLPAGVTVLARDHETALRCVSGRSTFGKCARTRAIASVSPRRSRARASLPVCGGIRETDEQEET
jgi:hypothetical protein